MRGLVGSRLYSKSEAIEYPLAHGPHRRRLP